MKKILSKYWSFLIILGIGFVPVVWFLGKGNVLISGVDINFPLDPLSWFIKRLYVWNSSGNAGNDFSSSTAGIFFHLLQLVPYLIGLPLTIVQFTSILFWSLLIVLGAYALARTLFPKLPFVHLIFVSIYSLNTYLFNTWENIKVANLSLVAAIPLTLVVFIKLWQRKMQRSTGVLLCLLIGVIVSGTGINPAYFISYFITILVFVFPFLLFSSKNKTLKEILKDLLSMTSAVVVINLFWIVPTIYFIFSSVASSNSLGAIGFTNWIDSLSKDTSIVNILRLQGAWDWYASDEASGMPLYIPYAVNYFNRLPFIVFSFLLPILAFLSLAFRSKEKEDKPLYLGFAIMIVIGVFMGVGTHEPTGGLFKFFIKHIPFFSLFRSPWYIFTPLLTISYAGLIGLLFRNAYGRLSGKGNILMFLLHTSLAILFIGNLFYTYPQITGKIFRPARHDRFYVYFPDYIFEAGNWLKNIDGRVIGHPDDELEQFSWGYRGIESILNLVSGVETIFSPLNINSEGLTKIIREYYLSVKKNETAKSSLLLSKLGVSYVFEKTDQSSLSPQLGEKIKDLEKITFGKWIFHKVAETSDTQKIKVTEDLLLSHPDDTRIETLSALSEEEHLANGKDNVLRKRPEILPSGSVIWTENSQEKEYNEFLKKPSDLTGRFTRKDMNSVTYSFDVPDASLYQIFLESFRLKEFGIDSSKGITATIDGKSSLLSIDRSDDTYIYFAPINFEAGTHSIKIPLTAKNYVSDEISTDDCYKKDGIGVYEIRNDTEGSYIYIHNTSSRDISANFAVNEFNPYSPYLVEVTYQHIYGDHASILAYQQNCDSPIKAVNQKLPNHPNWNDFYFYYDPVYTQSEMDIRLSALKTDDPLGTEVKYRKLAVYPVFTNSLVLKKVQEKMPKSNPEVEITKTSPVSYTGRVTKVTSPHYLIFLENYSKDWILEIKGMEDLSKGHFKADMYANAWYVPVNEDYSFRVYYRPQILLQIGYMLSFLGVLVGIVFYLRNRKRNG